jgi:5'-nucleotidase
MPYSVAGKLVVAISSRALFDFEEENRVFEEDGEPAYIALQYARLENSSPLVRTGSRS